MRAFEPVRTAHSHRASRKARSRSRARNRTGAGASYAMAESAFPSLTMIKKSTPPIDYCAHAHHSGALPARRSGGLLNHLRIPRRGSPSVPAGVPEFSDNDVTRMAWLRGTATQRRLVHRPARSRRIGSLGHELRARCDHGNRKCGLPHGLRRNHGVGGARGVDRSRGQTSGARLRVGSNTLRRWIAAEPFLE